MTFLRRTAGYSTGIAGIAFILLGAVVCFRSLERYRDAYEPPSDDLMMCHINAIFEIEAWALVVAFVVSGLLLIKVAKTLGKSC